MPFKFNLQKALDYREHLEEAAKAKLAEAERALKASRERLDDLQGQLMEAVQKSSGKLMQSSERWLHDQFIRGLAGDVKEADLQTRMKETIAEEARRALAARTIERKMLDKLKERQKELYYKAEQKREQNFNDEIATIRHKVASF